jgi:hypothetical protein
VLVETWSVNTALIEILTFKSCRGFKKQFAYKTDNNKEYIRDTQQDVTIQYYFSVNAAIVDSFAGSVISRSSVEEDYQYSPLEVRNPKKTIIAVVTAAIRSPSISVIRSLHNKKVQLKKHPQNSLFTLFISSLTISPCQEGGKLLAVVL